MYLGKLFGFLIYCELFFFIKVQALFDDVCHIVATGEQFVMQVSTLILVGQVAEEMIWNLLLTH
jgi:hypothetical protein